jgi:hypothetical protein
LLHGFWFRAQKASFFEKGAILMQERKSLMTTGGPGRAPCPRAEGACTATPTMAELLPGRSARCFHPHLESVPA